MDLFCPKPPRRSRWCLAQSRHHEAARFESKIGLAHIYVELGGLVRVGCAQSGSTNRPLELQLLVRADSFQAQK